jgi:hypothetical protein
MDWLLGISVIDANIVQPPVHCQEWTSKMGPMDRKGWDEMDVGMAVMTVIVIVPFLALAIAALRFGVDSRPGVGDPDGRPWLVG